MPPHTPEHQSMPVSPATLPAVSVPAPQMGMPASDGSQAAAPQSAPEQGAPLRTVANLTPPPATATASEQAAEKAKQLVATYAQDPFQLATLMADLKADYMAHEHHIVPGGGNR